MLKLEDTKWDWQRSGCKYLSIGDWTDLLLISFEECKTALLVSDLKSVTRWIQVDAKKKKSISCTCSSKRFECQICIMYWSRIALQIANRFILCYLSNQQLPFLNAETYSPFWFIQNYSGYAACWIDRILQAGIATRLIYFIFS